MSTESVELKSQFIEKLINEKRELLEALKKCAEFLPALEGFDAEDRKFLNSIKELIAKVEGES